MVKMEHNSGAVSGQGRDEGTSQISAIHVDISLYGVKNASSFVPHRPRGRRWGDLPNPTSQPRPLLSPIAAVGVGR
jgi:hypothetical protein